MTKLEQKVFDMVVIINDGKPLELSKLYDEIEQVLEILLPDLTALEVEKLYDNVVNEYSLAFKVI